MSRRHQPRGRTNPPGPAAAVQGTTTGPARRGAWLRPAWWIGGVLVAVAGLGGLAWWFGGSPGTEPVPVIQLDAVDGAAAATIRKHLEAVRLDPRSAAAWGSLGIVLREYGFKPQARDCLEVAERKDPANPRWPYAHGILLLVHSPAEAAVKLRRVVELCGNDPEAPRYRLARVLAEEGRWPEARRELEPLLQAKPDFAPARLLLALGARAAGELAEAVQLARRCAEDPRTARSAWALLAGLYGQQGDRANAEAAARRSGALPADEGFDDPFEAEAILLRGDARALTEHTHPLLAAGRLVEAGRLIDRLVQEHPGHAETWLLVGRYRMLRKEAPGAEEALRRHLELAPRSAQGWFQLGLALLNQNRLPESAEAFRKATEIKPDFGPAFFNRGLALARAGRSEEAITAFRETIRHNPEHAETYVRLAELLIRSGRETEALGVLDQARTLNPSDPRLAPLRQRAAAGGRPPPQP
jgi:tetratricopeptide (TPR) repeat protein